MAQITLNSSGVASSGSLLLQSNGTTTAVTIDTAQNMGLGVTPSAWSGCTALQVGSGGAFYVFASSNVLLGSNVYFDGSNSKYINTDSASYYQQNNGTHIWSTAASGTAGNTISFTQAMTLDASGNLLVGGTSNAVGARILSENASGNQLGLRYTGIATYYNSVDSGGNLIWTKDGTERARIDSSGNLLVGTTSTVAGATFVVSKSVNDYLVRFINSNATAYGVVVNYSGASPNSTGQEFLRCVDSGGTDRMTVRSNGGIANYSANNVNLSDRREKTNFAPASDYLAKICAIPVQTFNYIDQNMEEDDGLTLGVVAQDVQAVAPELVMESNWASKDAEPKMRLSIYQTDLQYALMKCIQEQQAIITQLQADVEALKNPT